MGMDETLLAIVMGSLVIILILMFGAYILSSIGYMKVFGKAGEAGWKGWVPFLCDYTAYKLCWTGNFYWIFLAVTVAQFFFEGSANTILNVLGFVAMVAGAAIRFMQCIRMSKSFGHAVGFSLGLFFLSPIFLLILGFGSSQYVGPQE